MWSFVQSKGQQRWRWHAIDHSTGEVLAYVLLEHKDTAFVQLKALLEPFGITQFYSDGWGAYQRLLHPAFHTVGKTNTQTIERKHLTLRTRIKRQGGFMFIRGKLKPYCSRQALVDLNQPVDERMGFVDFPSRQ